MRFNVSMYKVLFVCTGNICRSPTAEGVFRQMVENAGLGNEISVDSAGIGDWHEGQNPDARAVKTARDNGVDISALRARKIVRDDFAVFDRIIALDRTHLRALEEMRPAFSAAHDRAVLELMMSFAPAYGQSDVPDPYYGGVDGFQRVFTMIRDACAGLLNDIRRDL